MGAPVELDDGRLELLGVPVVLAGTPVELVEPVELGGAPVELDDPPAELVELLGALVEVLVDEEPSSVEVELLPEASALSDLSVLSVLSSLSGTLPLTTGEGMLSPPPLSEFITKNPTAARTINTTAIPIISGVFDLFRGTATEPFL